MVLGKEEHHLADFADCATFQDAARQMLDFEGSSQSVTFMKNAQKSGKFKHVQSGATTVQADKEAHKPGTGNGGRNDGTDWKRLFEELAQTVEHNASEMQGHEHTWKAKYQRLLQIRDGRSREAHMRQIEKGAFKHTDTGGGSANGYKSRSPQRDRREYRDRSREGNGFQQRDGRSDGREGTRDVHWRKGGSGGSSQERRYDDRDDRYLPQRESQNDRSGNRPSLQQQERSHDSQQRQHNREPSPHSRTVRDQRSPSVDHGPPENDSRQRDQKASQRNTSQSRTQLGGGSASSSRCYNCDGTGHLARDCPQPQRGGGANRRHSSSPSSRSHDE